MKYFSEKDKPERKFQRKNLDPDVRQTQIAYFKGAKKISTCLVRKQLVPGDL